MTWQVVNLEMKQLVKFVKAVSYSIKAGNCNALTMMHYVLFMQYTRYSTEVPRLVDK